MKTLALILATLMLSAPAFAKKIVLFEGKTKIKAGHERVFNLPDGIAQNIIRLNISGYGIGAEGMGKVETQNKYGDVYFPKVDPLYNLTFTDRTSFVSIQAPDNAKVLIQQVSVVVADEVTKEPVKIPEPKKHNGVCDMQYGNVIAEISCRMRRNAKSIQDKAYFNLTNRAFQRVVRQMKEIRMTAADTVLKARGYGSNNSEGVADTAKTLACAVYNADKFLKEQGLVTAYEEEVDALRTDYYKLQQAIGPRFTTYMVATCHGFEPVGILVK